MIDRVTLAKRSLEELATGDAFGELFFFHFAVLNFTE